MELEPGRGGHTAALSDAVQQAGAEVSGCCGSISARLSVIDAPCVEALET